MVRLVSRRLVKFVAAVQSDPQHPARLAIDGYTARLAGDLRHDPATMARPDNATSTLFDSLGSRTGL